MAETKRLQALGEGLWFCDHAEFAPAGIAIGTRTVVARLGENQLWLHAPGALDQEIIDEIHRLGDVAAIVAPNAMHHLFVKRALRAFPDAALFLSPKLARKRTDLAGRATLLRDTPPPLWRDVIEQCRLQSMPIMDEWAFFHRPSATLIVTDFVFHLCDAPNRRTRWLMRLNGAWCRFGMTRLLRWLSSGPAMRRMDGAKLLQWPFEAVVMAHGVPVTVQARARLADALGVALPPGGSPSERRSA